MLYTDTTNHFQITYPATTTPRYCAQQRYLLANTWSALSDSAARGSKILVHFTFANIRKKTYSFYAAVTIGKSINRQDVKNCYHVNQCINNSCALPNHVINNKNFHVFQIESAGMSHYLTGQSYRYHFKNACYAVEYTASGFNQSNGNAVNKLKTKYAASMQKMIYTFKFIITPNTHHMMPTKHNHNI